MTGVIKRDRRFRLKSGKYSDIYYDFGQIYKSESLKQFGRFFEPTSDSNLIFTSAYKGILFSSAILFSSNREMNIGYFRKEIKEWGDESYIIGKVPDNKDRVFIVDDVFTSGKSIIEISSFLKIKGAIITGIQVIINRGDKEAHNSVKKQTGVSVKYLLDHQEVLDHLGISDT